MKIEKKSLSKRIMAVVCVVAMMLTTMTPGVWAMGRDVNSITVNLPEGIELMSDFVEYEPLLESSQTTMKVEEVNGGIKITPIEGTFKNTYMLYAYVYGDDYGIDCASDSTGVGVDITKTATKAYTVKLTLVEALGDVEVTLTKNAPPAPEMYGLTMENGEGYRFEEVTGATLVDGYADVEAGTKVSFKVATEDGYTVRRVTADGKQINNADGVYTVEVNANTTISVVLNKIPYTVTIPASADGFTVVGSGTNTVSYGGSYSFYVTTAEEYADAKVVLSEETKGNADLVANGTQYNIVNIKGNVKVQITAGDKKTYTVYMNNGEGFEIKPVENYTSTVKHGEDFKFTVTKDDAYNQSTPVVKVDGVTVTATSGVYTINNIKADVTIDVSNVVKNTYHMTINSDAGATVTPAGSLDVTHGNKFSFTVAAKAGYEITSVKAGETVLKNNGGVYTTETITSDTTITVTTSALTNTVSVNAGKSDVEITSGVTDGKAEYNANVTFTVTPEAYYKVISVTVNNNVITPTNGKYTLYNVTTAQNIVVNTEPVKLTVNIDGGKFGKSSTTVHSYNGTDTTVTIDDPTSTNKLYQFGSWTTDGSLEYSKTEDTSVTLTANWAVDTGYVEKNITLETYYTIVNKNITGKSDVILRTYIKVDEALLSNPEFANMNVTAYGTLLANYDVTSVVIKELDLGKGAVSGTLTMNILSQNGNDAILDYNKLVLMSADDAVNDSFIKLTVMNMNAESLNSDKYFAAGWLKVAIGDTTIVLNSNWDKIEGSKTTDDTLYPTVNAQ